MWYLIRGIKLIAYRLLIDCILIAYAHAMGPWAGTGPMPPPCARPFAPPPFPGPPTVPGPFVGPPGPTAPAHGEGHRPGPGTWHGYEQSMGNQYTWYPITYPI